jgi:hypothetical protein
MLYIKFNGGLICQISETYPEKWGGRENGWLSVRDAESYGEACTWARYMTAMSGKTYLGYDQGSHHTPRFGVFETPKVGDPVSYSFNGDTYPCGVITKITPQWHITTSEGKKFRRPGTKAGFRMEGGTWSMVSGHIYEQIPSF